MNIQELLDSHPVSGNWKLKFNPIPPLTLTGRHEAIHNTIINFETVAKPYFYSQKWQGGRARSNQAGQSPTCRGILFEKNSFYMQNNIFSKFYKNNSSDCYWEYIN